MADAYGYVRVSGKGQTQGHGPQRQRELIQEFADANGYELVAVYEDAHTGTEADRPQFVAMLAAMMGNGVKVVIVESLDRLARDLLIQSTLLAKLAAEGLTLIAANTGEDVTAAMQDDPMRKAMVQIQGVFAELDKNLTVRKLRKARDAARQTDGHCEGPLPFGLDPDLPHEREALNAIVSMRESGHTFAAIADALNARGFCRRQGGAWDKRTASTAHKKAERIIQCQ